MHWISALIHSFFVVETGWKLVHGDVFRPPQQPMLLAVLVGTGVQTFAMAVITMIFAVLGFLSPANRGGLLTAMVVLFVFMGYAIFVVGRFILQSSALLTLLVC